MIVRDYTAELRHAIPQDRANVDDRTLIRLLNQHRAVFIKNEYNKNKSIDTNLAQEITVILEVADQSTVDYISTLDRTLASRIAIPQLIKISHRELVLSVRNPNILGIRYNYIASEQAVYAGNGKFNTKDVFVFIYNDRLYVKLQKDNPKIAMLPSVTLLGIFENPLECIPLQTSDYVDNMDYEYPMTDYIWGYVKANILRESFGVVESTIEDRKNDKH